MQCLRCQHKNRPQAKFCEECASPLDGATRTAPSYADLKTEVEGLRPALGEALEQQTATAEILRVIASSPADLQPVLDAVVRSAARLCETSDAAIFRDEGASLRLVAHDGVIPPVAPVGSLVPRRRGSVTGRVVLEGRAVHVPDLQAAADEFPEGSENARRLGWRATLAVPLMRERTVIGTIGVRRTEARPFSDAQIELLKTFADQAVIAIENVRLFKELEARNRDLIEALEQQTATSEILRVIPQSPTDVQPVFDMIAESAARLCEAQYCFVYRFESQFLHFVAHHGLTAEVLEINRSAYPAPPGRRSVAARAVLERSVVQVPDVNADPDYALGAMAAAGGYRSAAAVPILRDGLPIGSIAVTRAQAGLLPDRQIDLLQTFADQAVIAIENVRLFKELETRNADLTEALEQQTATSEILRVISRSPTDTQPVFDTIAANAARLCAARDAQVLRVDGDVLRLVSAYGSPSMAPVRSISRGHAVGRAVIDRQTVHIRDMAQAVMEFPETSAPQHGVESILAVPLLRNDVAVGVIRISRTQIQPFTDAQIALLQTFADQAVIAIENVRLFTELQEKNHALTAAHAQVTNALEQQTATSEILQVISQSPTETQPVFETIVRNAVRLCGADDGGVYRFDGQLVHSVAHDGLTPEELAAWRTTWPRPVTAASVACQAIRTKKLVRIADIETAPELSDLSPEARANLRARGSRSVVAVPMRRQNDVVGVISITHRQVDGFSDAHLELLRTFADQAVIAIENVRLFNELQAKNADLTEALEQQTATSEILRVIGTSPMDAQPVFDAIARSGVRVCGAQSCTLFVVDGDMLGVAATHGVPAERVERFRTQYPMPLRAENHVTQVLHERRIFHLADIEHNPATTPEHIENARLGAYRTRLMVPMLRGDSALGLIAVTHQAPTPFSDQQIALLQTFADQAVIAIENVRLFKELQVRTGELTQSVEKLTALGEVSRAVSSTLDVETVLATIVSRASQLAGAAGCSIFEYDEGTEQFELRATHNDDAAFVEALRAVPLRKGEGLMGRAAEMREAIQISDITQPGAYQSSARDTLIRFGYRALLSVPLLREDQIIGSLSFNRKAPGEFPPEVVDVLKTFATQSALAIQNARLFREIADKSAQLEAASRHKSEFLANMSHELRTPLNAIIGFSEVLAERMFGDVNAKQAEYLQDILESGRHLLSLINDILDLSKIEAGHMELERADFDLPSAIENALILVRERASRRGITLGHTLDERLGVIGGDERKVKQVLLNLLSNALKFTPEGGRIDVGGRLDGEVAEVSVTDTGIGIASADQEAVFEEFRQVGTAERKAEGTGLGLALTRKFVELHGGTIWVRSELGRGSTFTFTLPVGSGLASQA